MGKSKLDNVIKFSLFAVISAIIIGGAAFLTPAYGVLASQILEFDFADNADQAALDFTDLVNHNTYTYESDIFVQGTGSNPLFIIRFNNELTEPSNSRGVFFST